MIAMRSPGADAPALGRKKLTIGIVNNMPDAALAATERQFGELIAEAVDGASFELRLFALDGVRRGEQACALMEGRYAPAGQAPDAGLHALIVTGAEPKTAQLEDEPYWAAFAALADRLAREEIPTLWSCLAAHAAALHFDGVRRRPLPGKLSGVFRCEPAGDDPLLAGAPANLAAPHSRLNEVTQNDLAAAGYQIVTRSREAGVDAFSRRFGRARHLFLQGHPEYDAESLAREHLRDMRRFLRGERPRPPAVPRGYFEPGVEQSLAGLTRQAGRKVTPDLAALFEVTLSMARPLRSWRATAVSLFRNWLEDVANAPAGPAMVASELLREIA
jgi:homoserine O-succinyltransferase